METVCKSFLDSGMTIKQVAKKMDVPIGFVADIAVCKRKKEKYEC